MPSSALFTVASSLLVYNTECRYVECRYAECSYAECRGALQTAPKKECFVVVRITFYCFWGAPRHSAK
jgi:hypothetical protein